MMGTWLIWPPGQKTQHLQNFSVAGDCGRHFAVDKLRHEDVVHVILPFPSTPVVCQKYPFIFLFLAVEFLSATKVSPSFRGFSACPKWSLKVLLVSNIVKF